MHREETVSTLKFGQLCKTIKNIVKSNTEGPVDEKTMLKQFRLTIAELRMQLEDAQAGHGHGAGEASEALYAQKAELESRVSSLDFVPLSIKFTLACVVSVEFWNPLFSRGPAQ
jgi:hypothetical protein